MRRHYSRAVFGGPIMLFVGVAFAGNPTHLPAVELTGAAIAQAKAMLIAQRDSRAVLTLIKGSFEVLDSSGGVKEQRSGWMLRIVNREQFPDEPRQQINVLVILFPQKHLYSELAGATLDFSNDWWVLKTEK